jgi:Gram-negative bacterial TonB protein C-terminal
MTMRAMVRIGVLCAAAQVYAQNSASWPCSDDLTKSEGDNHRIRVSTGVSEAFIDKKILPEVSDLKKRMNSTVIIRTLVGKDGLVRCTDAVEGDPKLLPRSLEAAKQWQFKPYLLNGQPIIVETPIEFIFKKGKVTAR